MIPSIWTSAARAGALSVAALCAAGCSVQSPRDPALAVERWQDIVSRVPDEMDGSRRVWHVRRAPQLGVYLVRLDGVQRLGALEEAALDILVVSGEVRLRVEARDERLGPGGFVGLSRNTAYRLSTEPGRPAHFFELYIPDARKRDFLEAVPPPWGG